MDRGYARASLLKFCRLNNYLYIIPGRRDVIAEYREKEKICRKSLRLLADIVLLYILLLVLGVSELGEELRRKLEIVRHRARHGTKRTLSVLSLALMAITDTFLLNRLNLIKVLVDCLRKLRQNQVFVSPLLG